MSDEKTKPKLTITESMRHYRTVIVHGVSTAGKTYLKKNQDIKHACHDVGVDLWDTDFLPQFLYGSFSAVGHKQGPDEPERSLCCAEVFADMLTRRLGFVDSESSVMLVTTNNISIVQEWKELVLCSFIRPKSAVVRIRMEREGLDRATAERLMANWQFALPSDLGVTAISLRDGEFMGDYIHQLLDVITPIRTQGNLSTQTRK